MVEYLEPNWADEYSSVFFREYFGARKTIRFEYKNFRLVSFKKVDSKWHVTAGFEKADEFGGCPTIVCMVIDDETGEVIEMSGV